MRSLKTQAGMTLIEVIIVVVIVALLATIALPAYQGNIRKGNRSDGKAALLAVAGRMEQRMLDSGSYSYDMRQLGYSTDPMVSEEGHYSVDAVACDGGSAATCYVLTATPREGSMQAKDDDCTSLVLDYTGARSATGSLAAQCWK